MPLGRVEGRSQGTPAFAGAPCSWKRPCGSDLVKVSSPQGHLPAQVHLAQRRYRGAWADGSVTLTSLSSVP